MSNENEQNIEISDIITVMRTDSGRRFIRRIIINSGYFSDTFDSNPIEHACKAGKRKIGVWLVNELSQSAPDELNRMLKEHYNNE